MNSIGSRGVVSQNVVFISIALIVAGLVASSALTITTTTSIPANSGLSAVTAFRIAYTSSQFVNLVHGMNVTFTGAAVSEGSGVESIDANFLVTGSNGGHEIIVVAMATGPDGTPNGSVLLVRVLPA